MIDLRSDTVTRPSAEMRRVMADAPVGDDVFGDDPTVNKLEETAAHMLGMEAAVFVPSGTQANLIALMTHCQRGDEYIVGQSAHTYKYEGGGAAVLGSIQPQPIDAEADGSLSLELVKSKIKPDDPHFARTRLLALENTTDGKCLPNAYLAQARQFVDEHQLALHLDGARVFNAALGSGVDVKEISRHFDSVSVCLSKGLGAPVGSVLCGNHAFIKQARRWRKMLGGGMRQAGIIAAAGLFALENNVQRLSDDHENAELLATGLKGLQGVDVVACSTNMVFVDYQCDFSRWESHLKEAGILAKIGKRTRLVTHLDVSRADIAHVINAHREFFGECP